MNIALVGCGFLGSLLAEEIAKRFYAFEERSGITLIDFDRVEERNAANQNFDLEDAGQLKVDAVYRRMKRYRVDADPIARRVAKENLGMLDDYGIIISAVDNLPTRQLLWYFARAAKKPLLHLGVSQGGTGSVDWTWRDFDSWPLSPIALLGQTRYKEDVPKELRPCELIAFRGLGLNTALAGAKALGIFLGFDPEKHIEDDVLPRTITTWDVDTMGHRLRATEAP